jgi:hypothetical protein
VRQRQSACFKSPSRISLCRAPITFFSNFAVPMHHDRLQQQSRRAKLDNIPMWSLIREKPARHAGVEQGPAGKPDFSTYESGCGRETDSPLEGEGFEPSVPREGNYATRLPPELGRPDSSDIAPKNGWK